MAKYIFIILLVIGAKSYGQEQLNIADLDFLYQAIQKTPSYKDQLKNDDSYRRLYEDLRQNLKTTNDFEAYQKLAQLIYPVNDNHLGFYRNADSAYKFQYLKPKIDSAALQSKFKGYPADSVEGIYTDYKGVNKYVVYKNELNSYYLQNLKFGAVEAILHKGLKQNFDVIRFVRSPGSYVLLRNVKFTNGRLIGLGYQKTAEKNYSVLVESNGNFEYKEVAENIGYLRLSSFSSSPANIKTATDFFNDVKPTILTKNLIVDVRNNGGGGYKTSKQFINFLKGFNGNVYILQNEYTVSNAEQFIIQLSGRKNVKTLGATTKGTITYGSNYGNAVLLPSKRFSFYPTDMNGNKQELQFESLGIEPDIMLDPVSADWITQTVKLIK